MNEKDLAKAVAIDLGPDIVEAIGNPPTGERTRSFGISESLAIAGFLLELASEVYNIWQARQDNVHLVETLYEKEELVGLYPSLDPEKKLSLMACILAKFLPDSFGRSGNDAALAEKRKWVEEYNAQRLGKSTSDIQTRDFHGGALILQPFADMDWWIVTKDIGWIPGAEDGDGVVRVDVPKGYVSDLASIPRYLWSVLPKTGKYGNAAIYHDWLYWQQSSPRIAADKVFDRTMHDMGVDAATRKTMWTAVRIFGGTYWNENLAAKQAGEKRVLKKFPVDPTITWTEWRKLDVFIDEDEDT